MDFNTWGTNQERENTEHCIQDEIIESKPYRATSPTTPVVHPMAATREETVNTNNVVKCPLGPLYSSIAQNHTWATLTERKHRKENREQKWKKQNRQMSRRAGNKCRGRGIFNMTEGSYFLATASLLPTRVLSYFLWTETETPINPKGRAHLRLLLRT